MVGIYKITILNKYIYIGQSVDIQSRYYKYQKIDCKMQRKVYNYINKYGVENLKFEIIEECSREELNEREIYWIKFYNSFDTEFGLNLTSGGNSNKIVSNETKEKIRLANLGKISKNKGKKNRKITLVRKKHKKISEEGRLNISNGIKKSYEHRSAWNKGKKWQKKNFKSRKGTTLSEYTINKLKETKRLNRVDIQCQHCGKIMNDRGLFNRWHNDNCKSKIREEC